jgi:hypothetical protein
VTGAIVVGTGFGCFTHVRALPAAGFADGVADMTVLDAIRRSVAEGRTVTPPQPTP